MRPARRRVNVKLIDFRRVHSLCASGSVHTEVCLFVCEL